MQDFTVYHLAHIDLLSSGNTWLSPALQVEWIECLWIYLFHMHLTDNSESLRFFIFSNSVCQHGFTYIAGFEMKQVFRMTFKSPLFNIPDKPSNPAITQNSIRFVCIRSQKTHRFQEMILV